MLDALTAPKSVESRAERFVLCTTVKLCTACCAQLGGMGEPEANRKRRLIKQTDIMQFPRRNGPQHQRPPSKQLQVDAILSEQKQR